VNALAAALAARTTEVERMAVRLVEEKDGVMQLVVSLRELPLVSIGAMNAQPFKRLARLAGAHGSMPDDKGCCAACLLGEDGCDEDGRADVMGTCGLQHQGPKDQQAQLCADVTKTAGLKVT